MKRLLLLIACLPLCLAASAASATFVGEEAMKADLLQMLARFTTYMKADFQPCVAPNSIGEACGCFRGENTMGADERGVRPNADLSMICAFLVKYGKGQVELPAGVTWADLEQMAMQSLVFAYSTHKANRLKVCAGNRYWGSVSVADHVWESSLWAMSVAYAAFFQWHRLTDDQRGYVYQLLKAECNYELERDIPTAFRGDTKAEENGWEADVLAATLGLFPDDVLAPQWFQRLRAFAVNSYSHPADSADTTVIDPAYDLTTVADLYRGPNLYDDYTLQNHNYFHTSYQNVVVQELGEAALALKLFQQELHGSERWHTNALMHNNQRVMSDVLYHLALADGELAMPNGNDWSLFLYDQITSYSTAACFLRDPHALMLENRAYNMIKARQTTTPDGSWLLRPDVGARRMGVEAHRVMMTWLMHEALPTASLTPTSWDDFNRQYGAAKVFDSQNIVRASTDHRFVCFSWSEGLRSYTGYIADHTLAVSNLIVPFRANNTGNFLGWYDLQGRRTNAVPVVSGHYALDGNSYVMNGELLTNDSALDQRFAIYATPGNAVLYINNVRAKTDCTINRERGALTAISVDPFTKTSRTLYTSGHRADTLDGTHLTPLHGAWVNIDNALGIVSSKGQMAFGDRANNNSILTAKLYALYNDQPRSVLRGDLVDCSHAVWYTHVTAAETQRLSQGLQVATATDGWHAIIAVDPDSVAYLLLSNFEGPQQCTLTAAATHRGSPVFSVPTSITPQGATAHFTADQNRAVTNVVRFFVTGSNVEATQAEGDPTTIFLRNKSKGRNRLTVRAVDDGQIITKVLTLKQNAVKVSVSGGKLCLSHNLSQ
ncbi:MAG: hypothetical protein II949_12260 [Prevotella sp.]|nr:hypothetical protein [Prevotella sp.]